MMEEKKQALDLRYASIFAAVSIALCFAIKPIIDLFGIPDMEVEVISMRREQRPVPIIVLTIVLPEESTKIKSYKKEGLILVSKERRYKGFTAILVDDPVITERSVRFEFEPWPAVKDVFLLRPKEKVFITVPP